MKSLSLRKLAWAALLAVTAFTASLKAVNINFSGSAGTGTIGNSIGFSGGGVNVTATAWSRADSGGAFSAAALGQYSPGLGVLNSLTGGDSDHEIDNIGRNDFVLLTFSQSVDVSHVELASVEGDSDFQIWFGNTSLASAFGTTPQAVSGGSSGATYAVNPGNILGTHILIGASLTSTENDRFKLKSITFDVPQQTPGVPDGGSTVLLLGGALAGLGLVTRRRNTK